MAPEPASNVGVGLGVECPRCMHANVPGALICDNCGLVFDNVMRPAQHSQTTGFAPGTLWQRFGGFMVDSIILFAVFAVLAPMFLGASVVELLDEIEVGNQSRNSALLDAVLTISYETVLIGAFATTIGKKLLGLSTIRIDGSPVSFKRSFVRAAAKAAALGIVPGWMVLVLIAVNVLMVAIRSDKRALHDLVAGTVVVRR